MLVKLLIMSLKACSSWALAFMSFHRSSFFSYWWKYFVCLNFGFANWNWVAFLCSDFFFSQNIFFSLCISWVNAFTKNWSIVRKGNGNPLQRSCLENPRDGGAWWAATSGVAQSQTQLKRLSSSNSIVHIFYFKPIFLFKQMLWQKNPPSLQGISPFKGQAVKIMMI